MGRVRRDSLAATLEEEIIDEEVVSLNIGVDGRWIQCDRCLKWYHTACVKIQLDDNGEFSGDYYCRECRRSTKHEHSPTDRECKQVRRLSISSAGSSRSSGSSYKKLKNSDGSSSLRMPSPHHLDHLSEQPIVSLSFNNNNHNHYINYTNGNGQNNQNGQNGLNGNGQSGSGRKDRKTNNSNNSSSLSSSSNANKNNIMDTTETPIPMFHSYNWPHPVSYNRALHRVAQIL
ncbi:313_t:CDS:2 [Diversispora eburnea]|uniref:313_t:CDS:1 n=1 Tax=Diversispora eburnea TaxID=1213867 RepID=A0A9N8ZGI1_9GLOM|nr:313_t:CDS:2 [Diversispora eburnea]